LESGKGIREDISNRLSPLDFEVEALQIFGLETARNHAR